MRRTVLVAILAGVLGFGVGKMTSPSLDDVVVESWPVHTQTENTKIYKALLDSETYSKLNEDGKAAPCFCTHRVTGDEKMCEHEEFSCNETAAEECERRLKDFDCQVLGSPVLRKTR